ncbi:MAG: SDR family oxidoreductase [Bacteroidia bacterium]|nr:SDR family oxidoreductase [Bacteroidia bacterium]
MNILIFGANSDLGNQIAQIHASQGDNLFLTARTEVQLDRIKSDLEIRHKAEIQTFELDAIDFEQHPQLLDRIEISEMDRVYCVFGYLGEQEKAEKDFGESRQIIEVNYTGAVSLLNPIAEVFAQKGAGSIIGISSVAGERGRMSNYMYGSAKAAFTAYLDGMRNRLAHKGVHVMTVKPGFMRTKMTEGLPLAAPLTANPDKAAKIIVKAASKKKNTIYVLPIWRWVMLIIRNVPEFIFKKLKL